MLKDDPVVNECYTYPHKDWVGWVRVRVVSIFSRHGEKYVQFESAQIGWGAVPKMRDFKEVAIAESYEEYQKRP